MNLWPFKPSPKPPLAIQVVTRDIFKLRLNEWRRDERLVKGAAAALSNEYMQLMLQVLKNESPANLVLTTDASLESRAALQSRIEGFQMAINDLEAFAVSDQIPQLDAGTFEPESINQ